ARAVPHLLQEEGADIPGFTRWYVSVREHGLNDRLMAFFSGRSEYRLVFEEAVEVVQLPPSQLTNHCVTPAEEAGGETSAARPPAAAAARAFFEGQPSYSVIELCGRHLEHLARLVDFAEAQLGGPAPRPRRPMGYAT
ncbi:MAG: hypothetical protein KGJ86_07485, partial [Chloroflexota bacterium]|nr:hypothetical protein [Chloroflexota bacterium]